MGMDGIGRDAKQPAQEVSVRPARKRGKLCRHREKHVRDNVLGQRAIEQSPPAVPQHLRVVAIVEPAEG
jgi:hypothetical protein